MKNDEESKTNDDDKDSIETLEANSGAIKEVETKENQAIDEVDNSEGETDGNSSNDLVQMKDSNENITDTVSSRSSTLPRSEDHKEISNQSQKLRDMLETPAKRPVLMKTNSVDLQIPKTVLIQNKDDANGREINATSLKVEHFEAVEFTIQVSPSPSPKFKQDGK